MGTVPGITATNSSSAGLPMSTPPMTPMSTVSATVSTKENVLGKRDAGGISESEPDEKTVKKRRIAPTPVAGP